MKKCLGFNIDSKTLVVWSFSLETYKPQLMDVQDIDQASAIIQTLYSTTGSEISTTLTHFSFMNEAKVG